MVIALPACSESRTSCAEGSDTCGASQEQVSSGTSTGTSTGMSTVPELVGLSQREAADAIAQAELKPDWFYKPKSVGSTCSATSPKCEKLIEAGDVFYQRPRAGRRISPQSRVEVFVAGRRRDSSVTQARFTSTESAVRR